MRFGILPIIPIIFICLNIQLSYSQDTLVTTQWPNIARVSDFQTSTFRGTPCDDTEYRDNNGSPAWKNYGGWLSECDSLWTTYNDSVFAERDRIRKIEKSKQDSIEMASIDFETELDLDAMWDNTVWNEIVDIQDAEVYEVEQITAVAGVRGAEAEDEALHHLYYRRSMKGIALIDLQTAYGKLRNKKSELIKKDPDHPKLEKINFLLSQLEIKIKNT
jgi:hypothetical protein